MTRVLRATNGRRPGENYFAPATNDAGQKQTGGYAPPMADVWAKNISPLKIDAWGCEEVWVYLDDRHQPGRRSGGGVTIAIVGAKYFSPAPKMMWGRNGQAVTRHHWPTSGRKIFRPYKWMIGDAKGFAYILMIGNGRGGDLATGYQART